VPQTLLTLLQHTTDVHPCQFSLLEAFLEEPFPQTPNELFQLEQRLSAAAAQVADHIVLLQLTRRWRAIRNHWTSGGIRAKTYGFALEDSVCHSSNLFFDLSNEFSGYFTAQSESGL
jgi:hypothetical protein